MSITVNSPPPTNTSPQISSLTANPKSVNINENSLLICIANDSDGDNLTYVWEASSGSISGSGNSVTWLAPSSEGNFSISCKVLDGNGGEDSESLNITVNSPHLENSWAFNSNNSIIGQLEFSIVDDIFSCQINADIGQSFGCDNTSLVSNSYVKKVSFSRDQGEAQDYYGWFSADDKFITGYYKYGSKERPWYSFDGELPSHNSNASFSDLSGNWSMNSNNSLSGDIEIIKNSDGSYSANISSNLANFGNVEISISDYYGKITFDRTSGDSQQYMGWISADGKFISGYWKSGSKERAWYAMKI